MTTTSDFLVLGSGIAALRAALALAHRGRVCILTKGEPEQGSTGWAQGGIAAAMGEDDSPDLHYRDTLAAGDGLCEPGAVRMLVEEGPAYVSELLDWGARFDRQPDGRIAPTREAPEDSGPLPPSVAVPVTHPRPTTPEPGAQPA